MKPKDLLTAADVARCLGISRRQFYNLRDQLLQSGLETVQVRRGGRTRYTASSLDRLVRRAVKRGEPIVSDPPEITIGPRHEHIDE